MCEQPTGLESMDRGHHAQNRLPLALALKQVDGRSRGARNACKAQVSDALPFGQVLGLGKRPPSPHSPHLPPLPPRTCVVAVHCPVARSQMRVRGSCEHCPQGCPHFSYVPVNKHTCMVAVHCPVARSQMRVRLSPLPVASNLPSRLTATLSTDLLWP